MGRNVSINLGKVDAVLTENEQVRGEVFQPTERIKLYILEVRSTSKGPKILVSRTHPELVKRLFESEVTEVKSGIVEIKSIAREAGSRTKIAVHSNDPNVDAVGACVGMNGARVNAIVNELRGEKIDIITWNDNPAMLIENALSPAKVISVIADAEEKSAKVVVPDYQLSLAIGKEGQNARLAARLTGFKIDIKSETQAREAGDFLDYENDYEDADEYEEYAQETGDEESYHPETDDAEYLQESDSEESDDPELDGAEYLQESGSGESDDPESGDADDSQESDDTEFYEQEPVGADDSQESDHEESGNREPADAEFYDQDSDNETVNAPESDDSPKMDDQETYASDDLPETDDQEESDTWNGNAGETDGFSDASDADDETDGDRPVGADDETDDDADHAQTAIEDEDKEGADTE